MKRNKFKQLIEDLGYRVDIVRTVYNESQSIEIFLNNNNYLKLVTIDDTKPYTFKNHELFDTMSYQKQLKIYRLVTIYAETKPKDRN